MTGPAPALPSARLERTSASWGSQDPRQEEGRENSRTPPHPHLTEALSPPRETKAAAVSGLLGFQALRISTAAAVCGCKGRNGHRLRRGWSAGQVQRTIQSQGSSKEVWRPERALCMPSLPSLPPTHPPFLASFLPPSTRVFGIILCATYTRSQGGL